MSEDTNPPAAESGRRRSVAATPAHSGGGAKVLAAVLAVLVAVLAFALYKGGSSAGAKAEADAKSIGLLSNQVSELRTKLALEHSNLQLAQSNHQALVKRSTAERTATSNRLAKTSLSLEQAREETRAAQAEISGQATALAALVAQRDEAQRQAEATRVLAREAAELKEGLQQSQFAHAALQESLGRVSLDKADLERRMDDPAFLRAQARRAEEAAELRRRNATHQRIRTADPRVPLVLQPDGTVRPAFTASAPLKK